ncbi:MAG TPA: VanZ family protein, partial [Longimicrobiales bacterium]|nr:VanZ family protein [Longimicrobiales bacterium]
IELVQWVIPGRYPTVGDVIWNATGVGVGLGMAVILRRSVGRRPASLPAVGLALALPFVYLSLSGWLLAPRETDRVYFGQLTPDLGFMPPYRGELLSARSSVGPVPDGPWTALARLRDGDAWWIEAEVEVGPRPASVSPVVGVADASRQEILLLGIMGDDLVWRERTLANALRFDRPDQRLQGGLAGLTEGDTVTLAVRADGARRCLRVGDEEACGLGVTPGGTWGMLMYLEGGSRAQRRVLDVAWMGTLFVLVGLVGGGWRATTVFALGGAVLVGAAVAPTRLLPPDGLELLGLTAGVLAGVALRGAVRLALGGQRQGGGGGAPL